MEDEWRMNGGRGRHAQKLISRFKDTKNEEAQSSTETSETHETHRPGQRDYICICTEYNMYGKLSGQSHKKTNRD